MRPYVVDNPNESLRAAVASVFERPFSEVPDIDMMSNSPTWIQQLNEWCVENFASRWVIAFLLEDESGQKAPGGLWTPPGWYIEVGETSDGRVTAFQVCCGGVVMHSPFKVDDGSFNVKARMWLVVLDPAKAWPIK